MHLANTGHGKALDMTVAEAIERVIELAILQAGRKAENERYQENKNAIEIVETIVLTHYKGVDDDTKGERDVASNVRRTGQRRLQVCCRANWFKPLQGSGRRHWPDILLKHRIRSQGGT
jgi:hypothetical protein